MKQKDAFGVKALIESKGLTLSEFAQAMGSTPQGVNHWIIRGLPGHSLYTAADVLGMTTDALRPFTAEGRRAKPDVERALRAFLLKLKLQDADTKEDLIRRIQDAAKR